MSFGRRIVLVTFVLMSISIYWNQLFFMPKQVIQQVSTICNAYIWFGNYYDSKPDPIYQDGFCYNKNQGGLRLRNLALWDQAALGKLTWAIAQKQNNL